jgi:circadian clock protein KaiB
MSAAARKTARKTKPAGTLPDLRWTLRLYIAGQTPRSLAAIANLKRLCEEHIKIPYVVEIIDLAEKPHLASRDQIMAIPTLVRKLPPPLRKYVGDLSNTEKVLIGFDLVERGGTGHATQP